MFRLFKRSSSKAGLSPGSLTYVGDKHEEKLEVELIRYSTEEYTEESIENIDDVFPIENTPSIKWINVVGLHDPSTIEAIGKNLDIHSLVLEDILNPLQRPKVEDLDGCLFLIIKSIHSEESTGEYNIDQVSLLIGVNFVISFQEKNRGLFDDLKRRIKNGKERIRNRGADYLAYSIMDIIVDNYFTELEKLGNQIEEVEDTIIKSPGTESLDSIYKFKRELILIRKSIFPVRNVIHRIDRVGGDLFQESTDIYLSDLSDHILQIIDIIDTFRDIVASMMDIYLSSVSNRMNEVMKTLTIFASIFIPLTFIAGIYGMNFDYMPELKWHWGYFGFWGVVLTLLVSMLIYFKKKKWF